MEAAVKSLKKGKSAGVDNIPAELVQAGGEDVMTALTLMIIIIMIIMIIIIGNLWRPIS